ncbi:hypothetical protein KR222_000558 [Zaprionus bogoriensis]|nr:hypothetical protein KR222_000558 [Zaprionus bogoriensis]
MEDVLDAEEKPRPGRTIFFHETRSHPSEPHYILNLTARQACAIESAALHNPHFQIFVLFASTTYLPKDGDPEKPLVDAILRYDNVQLRRLDLTRYAENTPIEKWLQKGDLSRSSFLIEHTSDLLRLLSLYRYGGIYLDLDVVVLRSLEHVPLNYVGAHDDSTLGNAVISMEPSGVGHEFAAIFLHDFEVNYNGNEYVGNGPSLISRVMKDICKTNSVPEMSADAERCKGFKVFDETAFFPLRSEHWRYYFEPEFLEEVMNKTINSFMIHLWNKGSYQRIVKVGTNYAFGKFAEQNCPRTFESAGDYI